MLARIRTFLRKKLVANVVSLYGAYLVNYVVPLVTVPYLVRTLGPAAWGLVAMAQGFGNYLNLVVEYGFNLSATREVARHRDSPGRIADLVAGVTAAKMLLAAGSIALAAVLQHAVPALRAQPRILWAGVLAGIALGLSPLWYFQGRERMRVVATLEVASKCAAAIGVFFLVRSPADAWRVLALQAAASVLSSGVGIVLTYRELSARRPSPALVVSALRTGWSMFLFRSSAMLYTSGNAFLLGLFAPASAVGYFAGAEKISKAFMGLLNPLNQALYPRLSHLAVHNPKEGGRLFRLNALLVGAGGLLLSLFVFLSAPLLVRFLLGRELAPAVPVLRLLSVLPFLIGMNTVLSTQWMAPLGMDAILNRIICGAGVLNLCLAFALAPSYRQMGMACAVVCAELFIGLTAIVVLARRRARPEPVPSILRLTDVEQSA
jgi:PST family polysaccharide transporter